MVDEVEKNKAVEGEEQNPEDQILELKKQIADKYVEKLKTQKEGGMSSWLIGEGDALKDFLVTEGLGDKIEDAVKGKFMERIFAGVDKTIFDELNVMKEKINAARTEAELTALEAEIIGSRVEDQGTSDLVKDEAGVVAGTAAVGAGAVAAEVYDKSKYKEPIESDEAEITSKFGKRTDPITGKKNQQHNGIDISAPKKTPIYSIVSGKVIKSEKDKNGGGNYISIEGDDGKIYSYLHMNKLSDLEVGDTVKAGDVIGKVGSTGKSTGPHLHLTVKENDKPVDPLAVLPEVFEDYKMAA